MLKSSIFGSLLWPVERLSHGQLTFYQPTVCEGARFKWQMVLNWRRWRVIPSAPLPAHFVSTLAGGPARNLGFGIRIMQVGVEQDAACASAWTGFALCSGAYLGKLLQLEKCLGGMEVGKRPKGMLAKTECLVRHFIPKVTKNELADILQKRTGCGKVEDSPMFHSQNMEHMEGTMDESDTKDAKKYLLDNRIPKAALQKQAILDLQGKGYISKDHAAELQVKLGLEVKPATQPRSRAEPKKTIWTWTESHLKTLVPLVKGATIQNVIDAHNTAWTAYYPGPKKSRTISYGKNGVTSDAAAKIAFTWQWMQHKSVTGEEIPVELEEHLELSAPVSRAR